MFPGSSMLKTWIGRRFSMHSVSAVASITASRRWIASMWVMRGMKLGVGIDRGSAL